MEDRQKLLDAKAAEVKKWLDSWANETGIVRPGESLVLILKIRGFSVHRKRKEELEQTLQLLSIDFFTIERVLRHTSSPYVAARIRRFVEHGTVASNVRSLRAPWKTMSDFMSEVTVEELSRTPNVGPMLIEALRSVLGEAGLVLRDK